MNGLIETREDFDRLLAKADQMARDYDLGRKSLKLFGGSPRWSGEAEVYHLDATNQIVGKSTIRLYPERMAEWTNQVLKVISQVTEQGLIPQPVWPACYTGKPARKTSEQLEYGRATSITNLWRLPSSGSLIRGAAKMINEAPKAKDLSFDQKPDENGYPKVIEVASKSHPDDPPYRVIIHDEYGSTTCQCTGFSYRHHCRHTEIALKQVFGDERLELDVSDTELSKEGLNQLLNDL